jgi:hypothetical protein
VPGTSSEARVIARNNNGYLLALKAEGPVPALGKKTQRRSSRVPEAALRANWMTALALTPLSRY